MANINVGELIVVNTLPTQTELNNKSITVGGVTKNFNFPVVFRKVGGTSTASVDYTYRNAIDPPVASFNPDLSLIQSLKIENGVLSGIKNVLTLPENVTEISANSFLPGDDIPFISKLVLNEGLIKIGNNAFGGQSLKIDSFPSTITSIGNNVFGYIQETSVTLPDNCTYYSDSFKAGVIVNGGTLIT